MTYRDAYILARKAANTLQQWYEIWVKDGDYRVISQGGMIDGYEFYMSISPEIKLPYEQATGTTKEVKNTISKTYHC